MFTNLEFVDVNGIAHTVYHEFFDFDTKTEKQVFKVFVKSMVEIEDGVDYLDTSDLKKFDLLAEAQEYALVLTASKTAEDTVCMIYMSTDL
jgi:hypothetical protein